MSSMMVHCFKRCVIKIILSLLTHNTSISVMIDGSVSGFSTIFVCGDRLTDSCILKDLFFENYVLDTGLP